MTFKKIAGYSIFQSISILLILLFFSGCSDPEAGPQTGDSSIDNLEGTIKSELPVKWENGAYGGVWYDTYTEDPKSYNPFSNLDGTHVTVTNLMLDYLFDYDPHTREWEGNIIDTYRVEFDEQRDIMELYCTLRDNIFWSDGVQMTSDDVVWWFNYIEGDPDIYPVGAQGQYITMPDGSNEKYRIEKIDNLSFKYIFPRIIGNPLLVVNTGSIIPKHLWEPVYRSGKEAVKEFWGIQTPPEQLVGNGPFLLERNVPGERLIFRRNPNYWMKDDSGQNLPYLDSIVLTLIPDSNAELLKFQKGELDSYSLRGQDFATLLPDSKKGEFDIWNGGPASGYPALIFNHDERVLESQLFNLFSNPKFKAAVSCLVDRKTIINQVINGLAEPLYHIISESNKFYNPEYAIPYSYDPEKAARLFKELGLEDKNNDGYLEDEQGNTVVFEIMTGSSDPILHDYINIIISDLDKAGIKASIFVTDFNVVVERLLYTGEWHAYLAGFNFPTFPEQWYNIWQSSGNLHYWNPAQDEPALEWEKKIDEIYGKLIYTFREDKIREYYNEFQKTLLDEMVIIPVFRKYSFMAIKSKWGNINWGYGYSIGDGHRRIYQKKDE